MHISSIAARFTLGISLVFGPVQLSAQRETPSRPNWPWQYEPDLGEQMTPAERAEAMATAAEIERILWQTPELARPTGFEISKQVYGGALYMGERGVFTYHFWLWFHAPSKKATGGEGSRCIGVTVNGGGGGYFIEDEIGGGIPGATIVYEGLRWDTPTADRRGGLVVLSRGGQFPWVSLTREQYLRTKIEEIGGKNGETEKAIKESLQKTTYERWMEDAAARRKTREEIIAAALRNQGRAAAAELRETLEQAERDAAAQYKAMEAEERQQQKSDLDHRYVDGLRTQLDAMTPAERASSATVNLSGELVPSNDPSARRVLTQDPEFWRVRRSRVEVHALRLGFIPTQMCADQHVHAAVEKAYHGGINWAALKGLVDAQR
jgi:hypothetical protein